MAKNSEITQLKSQLRGGILKSPYLFFGEESFLIDLYTKKIAELVPDMGFPEFNAITIDGADSSLEEVTRALEGFPMMAERKLVVITDTGAFRARAAEELRQFYIRISEIVTDDTVLIIRERDVDKRSAVYKAFKKNGTAIEFKRLSDTDLTAWIVRETGRLGHKITKQNAELMISLCDKSLQSLSGEIAKMTSYTDGEITENVINNLASRSLEARVFDLCDALTSKNSDDALRILEELKANKESPYAILYLLYSSFEKLLRTKLMMPGTSNAEIASAIGVPPFSVKKYTDGAKAFPMRKITGVLKAVPQLDLSIKQGIIPQWGAVEKLVFSICSERK